MHQFDLGIPVNHIVIGVGLVQRGGVVNPRGHGNRGIGKLEHPIPVKPTRPLRLEPFVQLLKEVCCDRTILRLEEIVVSASLLGQVDPRGCGDVDPFRREPNPCHELRQGITQEHPVIGRVLGDQFSLQIGKAIPALPLKHECPMPRSLQPVIARIESKQRSPVHTSDVQVNLVYGPNGDAVIDTVLIPDG